MEEDRSLILEMFDCVYPLRLLEEDQKQRLAGEVEYLTFHPDRALFNCGAPADGLYLILEGQVRMTRLGPDGEQPAGIYESGNFIGFEALKPDQVYLVNATALDHVAVVRMRGDWLPVLYQEYPVLETPLKILADSYRMYRHIRFDWINPEEPILYIERRHAVFLILKMVPALFFYLTGSLVMLFLVIAGIPGTLLLTLIAFLFALVGGLAGIWYVVDWANDFSVITTRRVVYQEKVVLLYDSRQQAPLESVLAASSATTQIGRIVGYGDVILKTYTGTLAFPAVYRPDVVIELLADFRTRMRVRARAEEKKEFRNLIRRRFGYLPHEREGRPMEREIKSGSLTEWLGSLFRMRFEEHGVITYRTHWLILLKKIFLPSVALLGLAVVDLLTLLSVVTLLSAVGMLEITLLGLLVFGFWWWYQYSDWSNDKYIVTDDNIVDVYKKPLGVEEKRSAPLRSIQSVEFERLGLIGLLFNYGTVYLRIGDTRFTFDNVFSPAEVQQEVFNRIEKRNYRERQREMEEVRRRIVDGVEAYHDVMGDPQGYYEQDTQQSSGPQPPP